MNKEKYVYLPYTIKDDFGKRTITLGGFGKYQDESKSLDEVEAAILAKILLDFINKKDEN